ncbi:MAG: zinc ribbon domain-containing protein [Oscillospiraceae bacterium]|nr:zinc ribbon domain-containing protein [Oscillospiraceae bacterium]
MPICPNCNATVNDGTAFCTNCGAPLSQSINNNNPTNGFTNSQYGAQGGFSQGQQFYAPPAQYNIPAPESERAVSIGDWILTFIILLLPVVNIVMMFVWAFSSNTPKSKSNFFKAYLIVVGVMLLLAIIATVVLFSLGYSFASYI